MAAYYNEIDPFAAAWLRELIKAGHIADGEVDERSIVDVRPSDIRHFTQCHFFAGIGVWSYALRKAGWPDSRPVWTGSCPCQPFSAAGKGGGFDDERHLWPHFFWLISQCRPAVVLGEQVASKDGLAWLDLVQADLEGAGYASGAVDTCAAGFGAPHIRQRLYWVANSGGKPSQWNARGFSGAETQISRKRIVNGDLVDGYQHGGATGRMAHAPSVGLDGRRASEKGDEPGSIKRSARLCAVGGVADATGWSRSDERQQPGGQYGFQPENGSAVRQADSRAQSGFAGRLERPGPTNGFWRDPDWLFCRDGRWRPVEPGTFPLAHGAPARVGRLRGYGNAINAEQAAAFCEAVLDIVDPLVELEADHA